MIHRLYVRELFSFEAVDLSFSSGLVVLSGPSGAGKSLLIGSVLALLGIANAEAKLSEIEVKKPNNLHSEIHILDDELVIRSLKKDRIRYYLNDQNISKKSLQSLFSTYVHYLSVRDHGGFESHTLIDMLDRTLIHSDKNYKKVYDTYRKRYQVYYDEMAKLEKIRENERKLSELIEFTTFEINKIKEINPQLGEDESLLQLKKQLSRIDKINDALGSANAIFGLEEKVSEVFRLIEKEGGYFFDTMNQLRADFEETELLATELEDTDVEALLNRLEKITELKNRYGSIEEAIEYRIIKEEELASYERIEQDKSTLESFLRTEYDTLMTLAGQINKARVSQSKKFAKEVSESLSRLKLPPVSFVFEPMALSISGIDSIDLVLSGSGTATLSGGEHNRLKLALMVASLGSVKGEGGVIILDEIDANVSGDESIAIAELIETLSQAYQIFAISHQPHLAAKAHQHILVDKIEGVSKAAVLDDIGRIREVSRIIGGEEPNAEAVAFAKKLLGVS